jgi:hypothetical protein
MKLHYLLKKKFSFDDIEDNFYLHFGIDQMKVFLQLVDEQVVVVVVEVEAEAEEQQQLEESMVF